MREASFYVTYDDEGHGHNTHFWFIARLRAWLYDSMIDVSNGEDLVTIQESKQRRA